MNVDLIMFIWVSRRIECMVDEGIRGTKKEGRFIWLNWNLIWNEIYLMG